MKHAPDSEWEPESIGDEIHFDSFARRAGASLRSAAPEDGIAAVVHQGHRQQVRRRAIEIGVVGVLVLSGIAVFRQSDRTQHNVNTPPQPTTTPTTVAPVPISIASAEEISQWFVDYTGNPTGPASGEPVKFGVVMPNYLFQIDLDHARSYLNEQAGGVGGRPIDLDFCQQPLKDCADRFASDPAIVAVLENAWSGESIGPALAGRKPLHTTYSGAGTQGVGYYPTYRETVNAMALQAEKLTAPGASMLVIDAASDHADQKNGSVPAFETPDVSAILSNRKVTTVRALASEHLADTIRRAGATDAAAIVLATPPLGQLEVHVFSGFVCDELSAALNELGTKPVVVVDSCEPHEGWYRLDLGLDENAPSMDSGALPITTNIDELGAGDSAPVARGIREIGALLAVIRVINQIGGPAQATPAALDQAMREFTGPVPLGAGSLDCSPTGKVAERVQPGSCVRFVDVHQFVHDRWIDLAPIDLGT